MEIIALVVTYNRYELLKESIEHLFNQEIKLKKLIIVDNASTDKTSEYLKGLKNKDIEIITMNENLGGAGGFCEGIKASFQYEYDWIWIMDDDTLVEKNSLEKLLKYSKLDEKIGFLCSKVTWKNNEIHKMNLPILKNIINNQPFNKFGNNLIVNSCSFVSVLIKKEVIRKIGLPYREFFIWADDVEYTERITNNDYIGIYIPESVVLHKTPINYNVDLYGDSGKNIWKYYYGVRNSLFLLKKENKVKYILKVIYNLCVVPIKILKKRKDKKIEYIRKVFEATLASLFFNPKVEYINENKIFKK